MDIAVSPSELYPNLSQQLSCSSVSQCHVEKRFHTHILAHAEEIENRWMDKYFEREDGPINFFLNLAIFYI